MNEINPDNLSEEEYQKVMLEAFETIKGAIKGFRNDMVGSLGARMIAISMAHINDQNERDRYFAQFRENIEKFPRS